MGTIVPTAGRIVLYKLSEQDAQAINRRRTTGQSIAKRILDNLWPAGAQAHIGNTVEAGDVLPAVIVKSWGVTPTSCVNLQVFLDGNDTYWATSRNCGDMDGHYQWMPYQLGQAAKTEEVLAALAESR